MPNDYSDGARGGRVHYAWVVLAVTFVVLLVGAGVRATPSLLFLPLEQEFGWSRATVAVSISLGILLYGLIGPFVGALLQNIGARKTALIALALLAAGTALATLVRAPWQLTALWGIVVGAGSGMAALVFGASVVNRWFSSHRGLAMGLLTASTATGQLVFLPLLASLATHSGWRTAVGVVSIAALLVIPIAYLFLRDDPREKGLSPLGANEIGVTAPTSNRNPARYALEMLSLGLRSRDFLLLSATFIICGASTNGLIGTHLIPAAHDHGIPEVGAASLLAMMGIFDLVGTTMSGWLSDRWDSRKLLAWYYALRGISLLFLPAALSGPPSARWAFAVFYGLDWIATVPPTLRLTNDAFGAARAPILFGWIGAGHQVGAALATLGAGWIRTSTSDYQGAFWTAGALCALAAVLALMVGRRAHEVVEPNTRSLGIAET